MAGTSSAEALTTRHSPVRQAGNPGLAIPPLAERAKAVEIAVVFAIMHISETA